MNTADVLIIGAGPAGLSAAITLSSEGRSIIVLEKSQQAGGQAGTSSKIENYPPFESGFSGAEFTQRSCKQCARFGVKIEYNTEVTSLRREPGGYEVKTTRGLFHGRVIILAHGLQNRWLGVEGEDHPHIHHGMDMDALDDACQKHVVLVGGGNSAGQAAVYYMDRGARVTFVVRRPLGETMSDYLLHDIVTRRNYDVVRGQVGGFYEERGHLEMVVDDGYIADVDCVHIFIGQQPATEWLARWINLDNKGYIITNNQHQTNLSGIFAVGDVVSGSVNRVACAVGYGNEVVPSIHRYLAGSKGK